MHQSIEYAVRDGVAHITMDDGKVNVMSPDMLAGLDAALTRAEQDDVIVLLRSARPGVFSAGFDLGTLADADKGLAMVRAGAELALRLLQCPMPTIGIMEGHAYPMGAFLLLACDYRIGITGDYRIGLNEVAIGITPPVFAVELARSRLHPAWLARTVALAEMFGPIDAVTAGFLDQVVAPEHLDGTIATTLERCRGLHRSDLAGAKKHLRGATATAMRAAIDGFVPA